MKRLALCALVAAAACETTAPAGNGLAPDEIPLAVDQVCPGDPACAPGPQAELLAGAAERDVTPLVEPFEDLNGDGFYEQGEPFTDLDGDGKFDPVWLGGRNTGRLALGVHDPTWVRCYALRQDQTTLAHCAVDAVGYFQDESAQIRADLDPQLGVDLLMVSATHDHQTADMLGIWGPDDTTTGYDPVYMKRVRLAVADAVAEAVANLRPATLSLGQALTEDAGGDMTHYVSDTRDPVVIDDRLHLMQYDGTDGKPIVTVVNWAGHPDSLGSRGRYVSSDWVHYFREDVEAATGSMVVFVNGAEGGQIGPGLVTPYADDGSTVPHEQSYRFIEAWGGTIARKALAAFDARQMAAQPKLAFRHTTFAVHIDNTAYHVAFIAGLLHKQVFGYDPGRPLIDDNAPLTRTEVAYVTLGPAAIVTCPGELLPELFIGGYDGSRAGTWMANNPGTVAPPDPTRAPRPPYLFDQMDGAPEHRMVFGLTLDMLGYVIPRYNFYLDPSAPYLVEPPGDQHYEETNSIGPRAEAEIVGTMRQLVLSAKK